MRVQLLQLDDLVAKGEIRPPTFIKIDVEGHAHKAMGGARKTLESAKPVIIAAFHSDLESNGVRAILDPLGYSATWIATHSGSTDEISGHDFLFMPPRVTSC